MKITEFYQKIYSDLIQKRKSNPISKKDQYCERHHIIPRCMNGSNNKENTVNLTAREHYIAHLLLARIYKNTKYSSSLLSAILMMQVKSPTNRNGRIFRFSSRLYEEIRIAYGKSKIGYFDKLPIEKQHELREKLRIRCRGKKLTEEHKRKIGLGCKGRKMPESQRIKTSIRMKKQVEPYKRKVLCITTGKIYNSVKEATKDTNACVAKVCMGKYHSSQGLQFRYLDDELNNQYVPKKLKDKSEWKHPQMKAVYCIELNLSFKSLRECAAEINKLGYRTSRNGPILGSYIRNVANGNLKNCGGLHFKWVSF